MTLLELLFEHFTDSHIDAIANNMFDRSELHREADTIESEMLTIFDWSASREGYDYWDSVLTAITEGKPIPPLPMFINYYPSTMILSNDSLHIMNSFGTGINVSFNVNFSMLHKLEDQERKEKIYSLLN
jgi:hypothetical protein